MSAFTVARKVLAVTVGFFAMINIAKPHWSSLTIAIIFIILISVLLARLYLVRDEAEDSMASNIVNEKKTKTLGTIGMVVAGGMAILLVFMGCAGIYLIFHTRQLATAELDWSTVDATIEASDLHSSTSKGGRVAWSPFWTYSYAIGGQHYRNKSTALPSGSDLHWYSDKKSAEEEAASRAIGQSVIAYYDPADPQRSVLDRRTLGSDEWPLLIGSTIFFAAAGYVIFLISREKRSVMNAGLEQTAISD